MRIEVGVRTLLGEEVLELLEVGGGDVGDGVELHACGVPGDPVKPLLGAVVRAASSSRVRPDENTY